jgi:hypothetical protein
MSAVLSLVLNWLINSAKEVTTMSKLENVLEEPATSAEAEPPQQQTNHYGAPLPPFDPEGAIAVLKSFYEGDAEEQRETFEYLKRALNETRAAGGERLLFPDE